MNSRLVGLLCVLYVFSGTIAANDSCHTLLIETQPILLSAYYRDDVAQLREITEQIAPYALGTEDWHILYYAAFAHYHLANILSDADTRNAKGHADHAIEYLERANTISPDNVEIVALLGAVYGRCAGFGAIASLRYGPVSMRESARAVALDSTNSRALIVRGQILMYAPVLFGGDVEEAKRLLTTVIRSTGIHNTSDSLIVNWGGAADAHAFLALLESCSENHEEATRHCVAALELRPDYHYVRDWILPHIADKAEIGAKNE